MSSTPQTDVIDINTVAPFIPVEIQSPPAEEPLLEENWLEKRRRYIGGSDSASMFADPSLPTFGKDGIKYGCARRLVYQKRGQEPDYKHTRSEEQLFSRGHELEPIAADKFRRENGLGLKIRKAAPHRMSPVAPYAGVNLDYEIIGVTSEQILNLFGQRDIVKGPGYLEVKSANEWIFEDVKTKGVNVDYIFQMQHGLAVKRWEWGIFNVLGFGASVWELKWFPMIADKKLGDRILHRTDEVWAMVEDRAPLPPALPQPDPEDRCSGCQFRKTCLSDSFIAAEPGDGIYHLREDLEEIMVNYRLAHEAGKKAEEYKKLLAKQLMEHIDRNGKFKSPMVNIHPEDEKSKPVELLGRREYRLEDHLDGKAIQQEEPEIAAKYRRPVPKDFIKISVRGQKED